MANGEWPTGRDRERFLAKKRLYQERIEHFRHEARQDGYDMDPDSGRDFWRFVDSNPNFRKGDVLLLENGNLRAFWDDEHGDQIGLHFLGSGKVNYVIFFAQRINWRRNSWHFLVFGVNRSNPLFFPLHRREVH